MQAVFTQHMRQILCSHETGVQMLPGLHQLKHQLVQNLLPVFLRSQIKIQHQRGSRLCLADQPSVPCDVFILEPGLNILVKLPVL